MRNSFTLQSAVLAALSAPLCGQILTSPAGFTIEATAPGGLSSPIQTSAIFVQQSGGGPSAARPQTNNAGFTTRGAASSGLTPAQLTETIQAEVALSPTTINLPFTENTATLRLDFTPATSMPSRVDAYAFGEGGERRLAQGLTTGQSFTLDAIRPGTNLVPIEFPYSGGNLLAGREQVTVTRANPFADDALPRTWYFAEGAVNETMATYFLIANPFPDPVTIEAEFLLESGESRTVPFEVAGFSRLTIDPASFVSGTGLSTVIRTAGNRGVVAERAMYTRANGSFAASHSSLGAPNLSPEWYFAEGAQKGSEPQSIPFQTFILLGNPNETAVEAVVRFFPEGGSPLALPFRVEARRRLTIDASAFPELAGRGFSTQVKVPSGAGIVAERATWWRNDNETAPTFTEGTVSNGATAPATSWYFSEGNTTEGDEFILLLNPGTEPTDVSIQYLFSDDKSDVIPVRLSGGERRTINLRYDAAGVGLNRIHATSVTATAPIVAERSAFLTGANGRTVAAHTSLGSPAPATDWVLPEGTLSQGFTTRVTLSNPGDAPAEVVLAAFTESAGGTEVLQRLTIPGKRSQSIDLATLPHLAQRSFFTLVKATAPIVVERTSVVTFGTRRSATNSMGFALVPPQAKSATVTATTDPAKPPVVTATPTASLLPTPTPTPIPTPTPVR